MNAGGPGVSVRSTSDRRRRASSASNAARRPTRGPSAATTGDHFGLAGVLEAFVRLAVAQWAPREALQFAAAAAALREGAGTPLPPAERPRLERQLAAARAALSEQTAKEAWANGRALPLKQVLERALALPAGYPGGLEAQRAGRGRSASLVTPSNTLR